jgi:hypothetical protein
MEWQLVNLYMTMMLHDGQFSALNHEYGPQWKVDALQKLNHSVSSFTQNRIETATAQWEKAKLIKKKQTAIQQRKQLKKLKKSEITPWQSNNNASTSHLQATQERLSKSVHVK